MTLELLQGRRRKVAVVALVLACGLAGCWARSLVYHEGPVIQHSEHSMYSLMSHESLLFFMRLHDVRTGGGGRPFLQWQCDSLIPRASYVTDMPELKWIWHFGQFGVRHNADATIKVTVLVIPYWLPILLLAILSTGLLLSKPRRSPSLSP